jgi:hypothetical protein
MTAALDTRCDPFDKQALEDAEAARTEADGAATRAADQSESSVRLTPSSLVDPPQVTKPERTRIGQPTTNGDIIERRRRNQVVGQRIGREQGLDDLLFEHPNLGERDERDRHQPLDQPSHEVVERNSGLSHSTCFRAPVGMSVMHDGSNSSVASLILPAAKSS